MKKINIFVLSCSVIVLLTACDGSFTRIIDVDHAEMVTKGVVFGLLSNNDIRDSAFLNQSSERKKQESMPTNRIYLSNSSPSTHTQNHFYKGHVTLQSEDQELPLHFYNEKNLSQKEEPFYGVMGKIQPGKPYHITAQFDYGDTEPSFPKWSPVSGLDTMPMPIPVQIQNAEIEYSGLNSIGSEGFMDIKIEDEPNRRNMYQIEISILQRVTHENGQSSHIIIPAHIYGTEDRVSTEVFGNYQLDLINEAEFNRQGQKRISFSFQSNHASFNKQKPVILIIRLSNLSDNYVQFLKSTRQYFSIGENPFSEPAEIYSNIENGYGIFAFSTRSFAEIEVN